MPLSSAPGSVLTRLALARKSQPAPESITCQKCLQTGHWTYQCTNPPKILVRQSRTAEMKKEFRQREEEQKVNTMKEAFEMRKRRRSSSSSSGSSGSSSSTSSSSDTGSKRKSDRKRSSSSSSDSSSSSSSSSSSDSEKDGEADLDSVVTSGKARLTKKKKKNKTRGAVLA